MKRTQIIIAAAVVLLAVFGFAQKQGFVGADKVGLNIGDVAPELSFPGPDGEKMIKLSDLRGKYVLIDFWASWCGPCRRENPNVVAAYEKYKDARFLNTKGKKGGFEVYSLSLDRSRDAWVKAIEADKLDWPWHASDLQAWNSAGAQLYGVRSIPTNYLIDPNGVILAKGLRGMGLHTELDKYVKSL